MKDPFVLPEGLPKPIADDLDAPYWEAAARGELVAQRCNACGGWQWTAEYLCHRCHSFDLGFAPVPGEARIFSWQRAHHPVHPVLAEACPYVVVLVELPDADGIRMIGNLVDPPEGEIPIGARVEPVFEHHPGEPPYTLVHWRLA